MDGRDAAGVTRSPALRSGRLRLPPMARDQLMEFLELFVLAGFAGFTLAAGLAALYLWEERELKRRSRAILRFRAPSLTTLDSLVGRTIAVALPVLTLGMAMGFARVRDRSDLDLLIGLTLVTWLVYGLFLALRYGAGWRGRRAAYLALVGFSLVIALRLGLPATHFA